MCNVINKYNPENIQINPLKIPTPHMKCAQNSMPACLTGCLMLKQGFAWLLAGPSHLELQSLSM